MTDTRDRITVDVFRHDAHKFFGRSHDHANETFDGVPVNQSVPEGADGDAAALSRDQQTHEPTVPTHDSQVRLSLLSGDPVRDPEVFPQGVGEGQIADLLTIEDPWTAHERWLGSDVAAAFNESIYHPYTSLKYHTLLVAALLDTYRAGYAFEDLRLVVDPAADIEPYRTVYSGDRFCLRVDAEDGDRPSARLGSRPGRWWASTWNRLTTHPLATDASKYDMVLDANLRRIRSWSTALQYIEDVEAWEHTPGQPDGQEGSS